MELSINEESDSEWLEQILEEEDFELEEVDYGDESEVRGWKRLFHLPFEPIWSYSLLAGGAFQTFLSIYSAGFKRVGKEDYLIPTDFSSLCAIIDCFYIIDILLTIGCKNMHGLQIHPVEIRRPNWVLATDFLSVLPVRFFAPSEPKTVLQSKYYYLMQLINCLKVLRIYHIIYYSHNTVGNSEVCLQIFHYYFSMGLVVLIGFSVTYTTMCYSFHTICSDTLSIEDYARYFYISLSKLTTRGSVHYPRSLIWMSLFGVGVQIVYMGIICTNIGYLSVALFSKLQHRHTFLNKLKFLDKELKALNVPKDVAQRCMEFYDMFWEKRKGYDDKEKHFLVLPQALHAEVSLDVSWDAIKHSKLLRNMDIAFLRHVSGYFMSVYLLPGRQVYNKIYPKGMMLYVVSGVIQIFSEEDDETPILSFSGGTCLGESALIFNCKSKAIVKAKTACNLWILRTEDFMNIVRLYPKQLRQLRREFNARLMEAHVFHEALESREIINYESTDLIAMMWLKSTLHRLMMKDGDSSLKHQCQNVFLRDEFSSNRFANIKFTMANLDMLAISERIELITDTVFLKPTCPCIFQPDSIVLDLWNSFILILAISISCILPYFAFVSFEAPIWYYTWVYIITIFWWLDVYVKMSTAIKTVDEIYATVTSITLYRLGTADFLIDILCGIPVEALYSIILPKISSQGHALLHMNRIIKMWKIELMFQKWEKALNANILLIRYVKYGLVFIYTSFFWSCIMSSWNCFDTVCVYDIGGNYIRQWIWCLFNITSILSGTGMQNVLSNKSMYYPIFIICTFISTIFFVYGYASLAAEYTLQQINRIKLQEIVEDIVSIIKVREIGPHYTGRIFKWVETQWEDNRATKLVCSDSAFADLPPSLYGAVKESVTRELLAHIPLFKAFSDKVLYDVCLKTRDVILPPGEVVCYSGEICDTMYVIGKGYCKIVPNNELDRELTIGPTTHINVIESCLQTRAIYTVVTVTHCRIISLSFESLNRIYLRYPKHRENFATALEISKIKEKLENFANSQIVDKRYDIRAEEKDMTSFYKFGYNLPIDSKEEYEYYVPFDRLGFFSFVQFLLQRYTILPNGKFLYLWEVGRCACAILSGLLFSVAQTSTCLDCAWYYLLIFLDLMAWADIYLRLHICYYNENGILITHPLRTATHYLTGGFLVDFIAVFPFPLFLYIFRMYKRKLLFIVQLNRVIQVYRYVGFFNHIEKHYFLPSTAIHLIKHFPLVLITCVCVGSISTNLLCNFDSNIKNPADGLYTDGVTCNKDSWITNSQFKKPLNPVRVQLYGIYAATSMLTTSGMMGFSISSDMEALVGIFISTFSYIFLAHLICQTIVYYSSGHSTLLSYQHSMKAVQRYMNNFNVKFELRKRLISHYELKWQRKHGRHVHECISTFTHSLQQDILYDIYGKCLIDVSVFTTNNIGFIRNLLLSTSHDVTLKDSYIIQANDIRRNLHIIYKGKVLAVGLDGTVLTTLQRGSIFGNLSTSQLSRLTVNFIADGHAEILTIDTLRFQKILKSYPILQRQFQELVSVSTEYLEGRGDDLSSRHKSYSKRSNKRAINPNDVSVRIWRAFILINVCYIAIVFDVYQMAMSEYGLDSIIYQASSNLFYLIDIVVRLHTAYEDEEGTLVQNLGMIKQRFCKDRFLLWCSIITLIPLDIIAWFLPSSYFKTFHLITRMNRWLRFIHVIHFFHEYKQKLSINLYVLHFSYITLWSFLALHCLTCILITISCTHTPNMQPPIDCKAISKSSRINIETYVTYYYLITSTFVQSSQNLIYPESEYLTLFCIFLMIFSKLISFLVMAQICSTLQMGFYRQNEYSQNFERIKVYMQREQVSPSLFDKVYNYLILLWRQQQGVVYPRLLTEAPHHLRESILVSAFSHYITNHYIFRNCHPDFNRQLIAYFQNKTYFRDDYIVFRGTINRCMYFIQQGRVVAVTEDSSYKETVVEKLHSGMSFGMTQGLFPSKPYSYTFRATSTTIILFLFYDDWKHLLSFFPASDYTIKQRYAQYDDKFA